MISDALALEEAGDPLLLGDLADDRALAGLGGGDAERGRDGRLADPALAGHEDEPLVEEDVSRLAGYPGRVRLGRRRPAMGTVSPPAGTIDPHSLKE